MKISGIDKDFVDIINYLNNNGFKSFASCDGVLANHSDSSSVTSAYISFLKSPQIIDLMTAFYRDKKVFQVSISNNTQSEPYNLYGNLITGNQYSVSFLNKNGEMTSYFEKIIIGAVEKDINITNSEKHNLSLLSNILEEEQNSDLFFRVNFNSQYQPYMHKEGRVNVLEISTKEGYGYYRNMNSLVDILYKEYGIIRKADSVRESFNENEFAISTYSGSDCSIYFTDEHIQ